MSQLKVAQVEKGGLVIDSPFFTLYYDYSQGVLSCEDEEVLQDIVGIISDQYGTRMTRDEFRDTIDWDVLKDSDYNVLNAGVCYLEDSSSGWDGSINAVWFDYKAPGPVVNNYFQYWNRRLLSDAWKLDEGDVKNLGGPSVVLPCLYESVSYMNKAHREKVSNLIGLLEES